MVACINLDDENAAIAFKAESGRIRIILEPGEGLMFPERGVLWNRSRARQLRPRRHAADRIGLD